MAVAPIVVHAPLGTGGRPVTMLGQPLGVAHADADVLEFLRNADLPGVEELLDDPSWVTWRGGRAHRYEAA
ncbi:hypothetical protein ACFC18_44090 [Streptomyces sp. NPDC056121]|uniref:hypothetical protein n=1 Tax=unclassified Streptomyces TaxID=2593676 RepID=UPI0030C9D3AA